MTVVTESSTYSRESSGNYDEKGYRKWELSKRGRKSRPPRLHRRLGCPDYYGDR